MITTPIHALQYLGITPVLIGIIVREQGIFLQELGEVLCHAVRETLARTHEEGEDLYKALDEAIVGAQRAVGQCFQNGGGELRRGVGEAVVDSAQKKQHKVHDTI